MTPASNPFRGLSPKQIYALLTDPTNDLPTWPDEDIQRSFVAAMGPGAVRKTQAFINLLDDDGAFTPGWKGLDYGAGWGRIASLLLAKGTPDQLDLVDAGDRSLRLLEAGSFKNRYWKVPEILQPGDIPESTYDFAIAFSVFTHLSPTAFWSNLDALTQSIRAPGTVYFTVRHPEFVHHRYPERADEISAAIASEGLWFTRTPGSENIGEHFGRTIISEEYLREKLASFTLDYLGLPPKQMQHVYALRVI